MMIDKKSRAIEILKGLSMSDIRDLTKNFKSVEYTSCPIMNPEELKRELQESNIVLSNGKWYFEAKRGSICLFIPYKDAEGYSEEVIQTKFGFKRIKRTYISEIMSCYDGYDLKLEKGKVVEDIDWFAGDNSFDRLLSFNNLLNKLTDIPMGIKINTVNKTLKKITNDKDCTMDKLLLTDEDKIEKLIEDYLVDKYSKSNDMFSYNESLDMPFIMLSNYMKTAIAEYNLCQDYVDIKEGYVFISDPMNNASFRSRYSSSIAKGTRTKSNVSEDIARRAYDKLVKMRIINVDEGTSTIDLPFLRTGNFVNNVTKSIDMIHYNHPEYFTNYNNPKSFTSINLRKIAEDYNFIPKSKPTKMESFLNAKMFKNGIDGIKEFLLNEQTLPQNKREELTKRFTPAKDIVKIFIKFVSDSDINGDSVMILGHQIISRNNKGEREIRFDEIIKIGLSLLLKNKIKIVKRVLKYPPIFKRFNKIVIRIVGGKKKFGIRKMFSKLLVPIVTNEILNAV